MSKSTNIEILVKGVRFSYLNVFEPYTSPEGKKSYGLNAIIPPNHPQFPEIIETIKKVAQATFGDEWQTTLKTLNAQDRVCLHNGDVSKPNAEGYKGMFYISANKKTPFRALETRNGVNVELTASDGRPRSGDYGNVKLSIWGQANQFGKRINADPLGVQFVRRGPPLGGGGRVAKLDEFGVEPSDVDGDAPATAGGADDASDMYG